MRFAKVPPKSLDLAVLHDGAFTYPLDNGGVIRVAIRVDRAACEASIDFSGTSPAASIVAGTALVVQAMHKEAAGRHLTPLSWFAHA